MTHRRTDTIPMQYQGPCKANDRIAAVKVQKVVLETEKVYLQGTGNRCLSQLLEGSAELLVGGSHCWRCQS